MREIRPSSSEGGAGFNPLLLPLSHVGDDLTVSGQVLGSPNFMPPEQATAKHGKVGRYSDVYALGGILHHLLTAQGAGQGAG